jgi:hypothetical protein
MSNEPHASTLEAHTRHKPDREGSECIGCQEYLILRCGFTALPIIAGLDKFLHWLTDWDMYLALVVTKLVGHSGLSSHTFMLAVGVIESVVGDVLLAVTGFIDGP